MIPNETHKNVNTQKPEEYLLYCKKFIVRIIIISLEREVEDVFLSCVV